jgi:spermidine/putrescine transport system permease protein
MTRLLLFSVPVLWICAANLAPLIEMVRISFLDVYPAPPGRTVQFTFDNFAVFVATPAFVNSFSRGLAYAGASTLLATVIAYPLAYAIARKTPPRRRLRRLLLVIAPFWTSEIVRLFGIMLILANRGAVNAALIELGIIEDPLPLLFTPLSLAIGMLYVVLLAALLPIYAAIDKLPPDLLEAASGLGASSWWRFLKVTLPLTREGMAAGAALAFLVSLGTFSVPTLLGGAGATVFAATIGTLFGSSAGRWPLGAACGLILLVSGLAIAGMIVRIAGRRSPQ